MGEVFYTSKATDRDRDDNGRISYSLAQVTGGEGASGRFSIDSSTGVISVRQPLNYEVTESYVLTIKAEDHAPTERKYGEYHLSLFFRAFAVPSSPAEWAELQHYRFRREIDHK